jgi:hypothetical protein
VRPSLIAFSFEAVSRRVWVKQLKTFYTQSMINSSPFHLVAVESFMENHSHTVFLCFVGGR